MLHRIFKGLAPLVALIAASGCNGVTSIKGSEGVPLAELDLAGKTPTELVLAGPDDVVVTRGDSLDIRVDGDDEAVADLRFTLDDDTLGIMRENDSWRSADGHAQVHVTLPRLEEVVLAGSGSIEADVLEGEAEITVAGSGSTRIDRVEATSLDVTIAGSGTLVAAGRADSLELNVAGSGTARMDRLAVDNAEITIAGSGNAAFASDGTVEASIMGSGDVTVTGSARCSVNAMGSGTLNCRGGTTAADSAAPPQDPPEAPQAPAGN
jgi:hypothetical protein